MGLTKKFFTFREGFFSLLPLEDAFRTLNWTAIKRDFEASKIFEVFPTLELQN